MSNNINDHIGRATGDIDDEINVPTAPPRPAHAPFRIEREDCENGEIGYHIWIGDLWLCTISDDGNPRAKAHAELMVEAANNHERLTDAVRGAQVSAGLFVEQIRKLEQHQLVLLAEYDDLKAINVELLEALEDFMRDGSRSYRDRIATKARSAIAHAKGEMTDKEAADFTQQKIDAANEFLTDLGG